VRRVVSVSELVQRQGYYGSYNVAFVRARQRLSCAVLLDTEQSKTSSSGPLATSCAVRRLTGCSAWLADCAGPRLRSARPSTCAAQDPYLRRISGAEAAAQKGGPWFEYWHSARGQLFRRDQVTVKDMGSMQAIMRKCEYKTDPLSHQQCQDGYIQDTSKFHPISTTENCIASEGFFIHHRLLVACCSDLPASDSHHDAQH
jgi:hypothetical protein